MTAKFTGSGFTKDALTLTNASATQGLAFTIWGNPERKKLSEIIAITNCNLNNMRGGML